MLDKLEAIKGRFEQVGLALTNPEIIGNQKEFQKFSKEYRSLEKIVVPFEEYKKVLVDYDFAKEALNSNDEEMFLTEILNYCAIWKFCICLIWMITNNGWKRN
jgi:peptide chain release factor 1